MWSVLRGSCQDGEIPTVTTEFDFDWPEVSGFPAAVTYYTFPRHRPTYPTDACMPARMPVMPARMPVMPVMHVMSCHVMPACISASMPARRPLQCSR